MKKYERKKGKKDKMKLGVGYDNGKAMVLGRGRASAGGEYDRNILYRNFKELTK